MEIAAQLDNGHSVMQEMIKTLGYQKVYCRWVLCLLMDEHKRERMDASSLLLQRCAAKGDHFLLSAVTSNESWFQHFDPKTV
jgi:hypothetical protein